MPAYVFKCSCELEHSADYPIGEAPDVRPCPDCAMPARRVIRWDGAIRLRGKGWASKPERDLANFKHGPQDPKTIARSRKEAGYD